MDQNELKNYGPLAALIGKWEGKKGDDFAPGDDRGVEMNQYREVAVYEPIGATQNHEQTLYGLRYHMTAWRLNEATPFHEELGYMSWDPKEQQVFKSVMVPRGTGFLAGGSAKSDSKTFDISAKLGSHTYGIVSNLFLDREFKSVAFDAKYTIHDDNSFTYDQDLQIQVKGQSQIFHHRDGNRLYRV
jgi:hypothetical protein